MEKWLKSLTSFTGAERLGLVGLVFIMLLLILVRWAMHFFVHPDFAENENRRLELAWDSFKAYNTRVQPNDSVLNEQLSWLDRPSVNALPMPDTININTADSALLVRLKGIGPAIAGKIIRWRRANGKFKTVDELQNVHHIPDATFAAIRKHLRV